MGFEDFDIELYEEDSYEDSAKFQLCHIAGHVDQLLLFVHL